MTKNKLEMSCQWCEYPDFSFQHCKSIFLDILYEFISEFKNQTPNEIRQLGSSAIRQFYSALQGGGYVNKEIRCMFVGHFGVGKTTIVKSLLLESNNATKSTDGIEVHVRKCSFNEITKEWCVQGEL